MVGTKNVLGKLDALIQTIETDIPNEINDQVERRAQNAGDAFNNAVYNGNNDVVVSVDTDKKTEWTITASGEAVMFIEFGSGVNLRHDNPWNTYAPASWSATHAGFLVGKKLAKYRGWWPLPKEVFGKSGYFTEGNPSANIMYDTSKGLETRFRSKLKSMIRDAIK